jgi:hypothetical protein
MSFDPRMVILGESGVEKLVRRLHAAAAWCGNQSGDSRVFRATEKALGAVEAPLNLSFGSRLFRSTSECRDGPSLTSHLSQRAYPKGNHLRFQYWNGTFGCEHHRVTAGSRMHVVAPRISQLGRIQLHMNF